MPPASRHRPSAPAHRDMIPRLLLAGTTVLAFCPSISAQAVPSPESVLGQRVGADFFLATFEESMDYFERLDAASDRVVLRNVGESSFGRPMRVAFISDAANLAELDRHVQPGARLRHHPRRHRLRRTPHRRRCRRDHVPHPDGHRAPAGVYGDHPPLGRAGHPPFPGRGRGRTTRLTVSARP